MSIMDKYITIAELARELNISKATAYNLINNEPYKKYVKVINGTKNISIKAIEVYQYGEQRTIEDFIKEKEIEDNINKESAERTKESNKENDSKYKDYKYIIEYQNKRIEELEKQLKEKDNIILEYSNKFADMAKQAQDIAVSALNTTGQAQYLQATQQKETPIEIINDEVKTPKKKGFFAMLFGKQEDRGNPLLVEYKTRDQ